jgi:CO dehydrogenase/acetyl-CoA synthase beta subunit
VKDSSDFQEFSNLVELGGSIKEAIMNICCEERDDDLHDYVKKFMSLENFGVVVTNIDRRKSEEKRLSLKMIADTVQNVGKRYEVGLPYQNNVDPFPESRSEVALNVNWRKQEGVR